MTEKGTFTLKDWSDEDKPREKMAAHGKKSLSDAEIIGILIGSGSPGESAVDLAKRMLKDNGNSLSRLSRLEINDLVKGYNGIGEAKAISILAALELGYRMLKEKNDDEDVTIHSSEDIFKYVGHKLVDLPHEECWAVYLNVRGKPIDKKLIAKGGLTETTVDVRIIFKAGLERNATSIALVHNHPTGNLKPSKQDDNLTRNILEAGKILHINLIDHLIVGITPEGEPNYYSYFDAGKI